MSNLNNAQLIGSWFNATGSAYCADDNTYTEYPYARQAWACPVALCSQLTCARPLTADEWMAELFGDS